MKVMFKIQAKDLAGQNISILVTKLPPHSTPYKNDVARCHFSYKLLSVLNFSFASMKRYNSTCVLLVMQQRVRDVCHYDNKPGDVG